MTQFSERQADIVLDRILTILAAVSRDPTEMATGMLGIEFVLHIVVTEPDLTKPLVASLLRLRGTDSELVENTANAQVQMAIAMAKEYADDTGPGGR